MKLYEKAPPGAKAESWVKANKARFKKRYGETAGERVLYAKAWKLFGEEVIDEDAAPTNVMGASAADPNSPPIQGFSPMLHKKALKRKVKDVKLDRILALIRRGLK